MSAGRSEQIGKGCSEDRGEIGSEIGEGFREFCTLMFATHVVVVGATLAIATNVLAQVAGKGAK